MASYSRTGKTISSLELPNPAPDWLDKRMWGEIATLSTLPAFHGLADDVRTVSSCSTYILLCFQFPFFSAPSICDDSLYYHVPCALLHIISFP